MDVIRLDDLKEWRARRIQSGACSFDDMTALGGFISECEKIETKEVKYFDEDENVWKIGEAL